MTKPSKRDIDAKYRTDFRPFVEKVFCLLNPGQTFIPEPYLWAIAHQLERVREGKIRRLIINMPPRSLKSITCSVAFPAYLLGRDPTCRFICVSYSAELSKKHSNDFRAILESNWYTQLFPSTRIGPYKNSETEIELTGRGGRLATSVGGTLTGRGGDIIIIDDPLKPDDAFSVTRRNQVNEWYKNVLLSRLNDKRTGIIIIVMQRVHPDDLAGFLRSQSDEWEVLSLPAIADSDETILGWDGVPFHRKAGEVLSPEREPLEVLNAIKQQIGSGAFSAQYQQMPVPPGGAMIKRDWIKRYDELPPPSERLLVVQSWDTASKGGPENDWSVCTTWFVCRGNRFYLVDVWRDRVDYPSLKFQVNLQAMAWRARRVLVEEAGAGIGLVQELVSRISGIIPVKADKDKISRMAVASAKIEAGQVFLPKQAWWLADLESELFAFPYVRHNDQCDSISQALNDEGLASSLWMTKENMEELCRKVLKMPPRPRVPKIPFRGRRRSLATHNVAIDP
jgi:predicted phage terminase large subunit-like protein